MKTTKIILSFLISILFISCSDQMTPLTPSVIKNITKTDTIKTDTLKDTIKHNYFLIRYGVMFMPFQSSFSARGIIVMEVCNNITQDSINKYIDNFYGGMSYYYRKDTLTQNGGSFIMNKYMIKPFALLLPTSKTDTIVNNYILTMNTSVSTNVNILGLKGNTDAISPQLDVTKTSLEFIIKSLSLDTIVKVDTINFSFKIKCVNTEIIK